MSLTRKMLKGMGLTEEQVDSIIEEHTSVTDALKEQAQKYEADAKKLSDVQKELDNLKEGGSDWEDRYNKEHEAFEAYKKDAETKAESEKVRAAYRALLKSQNVSDKWIDSIINLTDSSLLRLTKEGKIANEDKVIDMVKEKFAVAIPTESAKGAGVETPPNREGQKMSRAEIFKKDDNGKYLLSASERQKAIAENLDQFGYSN